MGWHLPTGRHQRPARPTGCSRYVLHQWHLSAPARMSRVGVTRALYRDLAPEVQADDEETGGSLVRRHTYRAHVAPARRVRVPHLRAPAPGTVGNTKPRPHADRFAHSQRSSGRPRQVRPGRHGAYVGAVEAASREFEDASMKVGIDATVPKLHKRGTLHTGEFPCQGVFHAATFDLGSDRKLNARLTTERRQFATRSCPKQHAGAGVAQETKQNRTCQTEEIESLAIVPAPGRASRRCIHPTLVRPCGA